MLVVVGSACGDSIENGGADAAVEAGQLDAATDAATTTDASPDGSADAAVPCEAGLQDNDGNGTCTADCTATTCGLTGTCDAASGTATCTCVAGYAGADCSDCDAGYQDQDEDGVCHPACAAETCSGHGTCTIAVGMTTCACAGGYTGSDCSSCPADTQDRDDNGTCMPACMDETCSGHGSCDDASGTATCGCLVGYAGTDCGTCDEGYQDDDEDGTCEAVCTETQCSGRGTCSTSSGTATCSCDAGYAGGACDVCDAGFQDEDGNGTCLPDCSGNDCSGHGTCGIVAGEGVCACASGFGGPSCELTCTRTEIVPVACTGADSIVCATLMDGNGANTQDAYCSEAPTPSYCGFEGTCAANGCIEDMVLLFDLGTSQTMDRVRFNADWWNKRPDAFEVWVSDDPGQGPGTGATLVYAGHAHAAPWRCVTGESCTDESVPDACCPDGRAAPQDTRDVGTFRSRYDIADFAPVTARYVHYVVRDVYVKNSLVLMEIDVFSSICTGP